MKVAIRNAKKIECKEIYNIMHEDMTWKNTDAPYLPYEKPTLSEFRHGYFKKICTSPQRKIITIENHIIGTVCFYWEDKFTRWLEIGLTIFSPRYRGTGIGSIVLPLWIDEVFSSQIIARVGLTTWSGNIAMIKLAEKIGMKQEARLRKVRFYNKQYYDSIRYGILREEWYKRSYKKPFESNK